MESEFFLRDAIALHETLFQCKADPNIRNWAGDTALHAVVDNGHNKDIISLLLDHGADINAKDFNSCTALHIAASRDLIDLPDRPTPAPHVSNPGQIFVASNAKSQQRIDDLLSHRDWGHRYGIRASWNPKAHLDALELPLERDANTTIRNHNNRNPKHVASSVACQLILNHLIACKILHNDERPPGFHCITGCDSVL